MNEFRFANPTWIHAIWIALSIAALLVVLELRGRSILDLLVSRLMQKRLVHRTSLLRRITAIALATMSMILLIVALMRPQWGRSVEQAIRVDSQIMVCLDVSKSMLAEDVAPNRLERAKVELESLLGLMRDGQQVGLTAFAGKASVLCPMTTDFGFLRLVLAEADPRSVGLGGTKIGGAIQMALDGFREAGDINRMILLITDGEDHDSFPLDAAKKAKENGVRIVAVGFGDESGSKIEITDPRTGVRSFLKDRDGKEVVSRLDGETLRDIVMETEGAYVPAGTGALDLESIYQKHIETILKGSLDSQQRVIRNEAYQWFVLGAIILMIMALMSSTPWNLKNRALAASQAIASQAPGAVSGAVILLTFGGSAQPSFAQQSPPSSPVTSTQTAEQARANESSPERPSKNAVGETAEDADVTIDESLPPRTIYNQALAMLKSDPDQAERFLNHARTEAGTDGELRFRTLYNLGWVEVNRADALLQNEPQQALQHLHQAANRLREAIRVRPESSEARQNLEIVSRRILELTDALRKKEPGDLAARLDALIMRSREHQAELQAIVQEINRRDDVSVGAFRSDFNRLAVIQRQLISDTQQFSDDAIGELDAVDKKPDEEKSAEDKVRVVQLQNMLSFIDNGVQRMNKSRSLTRRLQSDGSFRRWSSALSDLKRARDQLRHPVEVLGQLVADATEMAQLTQMLALGKLSLASDDQTAQIPAWVTKDYITDVLAATIERAMELEQVFTNITAAQNDDQPPPDAADQPEEADPRTEQLLENIEVATPMVRQARELFEGSNGELENNAIDVAHQKQIDGIAQLTRAWELFFDIRRLIELIYRHQKLAQSVIGQSAEHPESIDQLRTPLARTQQANLKRCDRLTRLLELEKSLLPVSASAEASPGATTPAQTAGAGTDDQNAQVEAQRQRLDLAEQLLQQVIAEIKEAQSLLQDDATPKDPAAPDAKEELDITEDAKSNPATVKPPPSEGPLHDAGLAVDRSIMSLEELRRLFFSLVEHLRDTAQRQADLNDETTKLSADETAAETPEKTGPLAMRQQQLQDIAQQISDALQEQSEQAKAAAQQPAEAEPGGQAPSPQDAAAAAEKLAQAGDLVDVAQQTMLTAAQQLLAIAQGSGQPVESFSQAQENQSEALEKLAEALALLQDNTQQNQQQQNQQDQDQQQDEDNQQQQKQQQQMDANQLLQLIRDREAERRKDKKRRAAAAGTVDKDW